MLSLARSLRILVAAAGVALVPFAAAAQPNVTPQIVVPVPGGPPQMPVPVPAAFPGCYQVTQQLYGPYYMQFCLDHWGNGTYTVTGALYCNGRLAWSEWGGQAHIRLQFAHCGGGVGWSPDQMTCVVTYSAPPPVSGPGFPFGGQPRIAVPVPVGGDLRCNYQPSVRGYQPISILAQKVAW
jgi:hypothetical protein